MKAFKRVAALALGFALLAPAAQANTHEAATATQQQTVSSEGEIRRIDRDAKKLTIRHGPIQNLDMPPMTMVFQVSDPALLNSVKAGDKVRFRAEKNGGAYVVTHIEAAR